MLALLKDQHACRRAAAAPGDRRQGSPTIRARDAFARELAARFDAARARGDTSHEKEEARFALAVLGQAERALQLALRQLRSSSAKLADARIVLEAALAARQRAAAEPVLQWMAASGVESPALHALAGKLKELR